MKTNYEMERMDESSEWIKRQLSSDRENVLLKRAVDFPPVIHLFFLPPRYIQSGCFTIFQDRHIHMHNKHQMYGC